MPPSYCDESDQPLYHVSTSKNVLGIIVGHTYPRQRSIGCRRGAVDREGRFSVEESNLENGCTEFKVTDPSVRLGACGYLERTPKEKDRKLHRRLQGRDVITIIT